MRLVSINVGRPREIVSSPQTVLTSIRKAPVSGRVGVLALNVDSDQ
jgi:hypothetical protein